MAFMLLVGFIFWSVIAFVGTRKAFEQGGNALCDKLRQIKAAQPPLLLVVGLCAPIVGVLLVLVEMDRMLHHLGSIGGFASPGFLLGIAGAVALAAHLEIHPSVVRPRGGRPSGPSPT